MSKAAEYRLQAELKKLSEHYGLLLDINEKNNARIAHLEDSLHAIKADRKFLLNQIRHHKKTLQHPTKVDRILYASAKDVARNPSK